MKKQLDSGKTKKLKLKYVSTSMYDLRPKETEHSILTIYTFQIIYMIIIYQVFLDTYTYCIMSKLGIYLRIIRLSNEKLIHLE